MTARKTVIYSPVMDKFMDARDIRYYGTAVDLGLTPQNIVKSIPKNYHLTPNMDIDWNPLAALVQLWMLISCGDCCIIQISLL